MFRALVRWSELWLVGNGSWLLPSFSPLETLPEVTAGQMTFWTSAPPDPAGGNTRRQSLRVADLAVVIYPWSSLYSSYIFLPLNPIFFFFWDCTSYKNTTHKLLPQALRSGEPSQSKIHIKMQRCEAERFSSPWRHTGWCLKGGRGGGVGARVRYKCLLEHGGGYFCPGCVISHFKGRGLV